MTENQPEPTVVVNTEQPVEKKSGWRPFGRGNNEPPDHEIERITIRSYPKIIFLYPSVIFAFIAAIFSSADWEAPTTGGSPS